MSDPKAFDAAGEGKRWAEEFGRGISEGVPEAQAAAAELARAVEQARREQEMHERVVREQAEHDALSAKQRVKLDGQLETLRVEIIGDSRAWAAALSPSYRLRLRRAFQRVARRRSG